MSKSSSGRIPLKLFSARFSTRSGNAPRLGGMPPVSSFPPRLSVTLDKGDRRVSADGSYYEFGSTFEKYLQRLDRLSTSESMAPVRLVSVSPRVRSDSGRKENGGKSPEKPGFLDTS